MPDALMWLLISLAPSAVRVWTGNFFHAVIIRLLQPRSQRVRLRRRQQQAQRMRLPLNLQHNLRSLRHRALQYGRNVEIIRSVSLYSPTLLRRSVVRTKQASTFIVAIQWLPRARHQPRPQPPPLRPRRRPRRALVSSTSALQSSSLRLVRRRFCPETIWSGSTLPGTLRTPSP